MNNIYGITAAYKNGLNVFTLVSVEKLKAHTKKVEKLVYGALHLIKNHFWNDHEGDQWTLHGDKEKSHSFSSYGYGVSLKAAIR